MIRIPLRWMSAAVAAVIVAITVLLAWLAEEVDDRANQDLLDRQVEQAATVLTGNVSGLQVQLADAGLVAIATDADPGPFQRFAAARMDATGSFVSLSLLRVGDGATALLATEGEEPRLPDDGLDSAFFADLRPDGKLMVAGILPADPDRLAYALMPAGDSGLVVYAEQALDPDRQVSLPESGAFSGLDFALYLGDRADPDNLLLATAAVPIAGPTGSATLPLGDGEITVVGAAQVSLTGALAAALPWIVVGVGGALAVVTALTVETLARRRTVAERLAADNERLYLQQRGIAGTLQHAMLPEVPPVDGLEIAARYSAGVDELEVGGDWYDLIPRGPGCCVFVVGDVSGRGLPAATTMAALRFAVRAYLAQGDDIDAVMVKLHGLLRIDVDHQFATVLIGELDGRAGRLRLVCAGHFPPLLVAGGSAELLECPVAPPVGVGSPSRATITELQVPASATLLAFTDGLVERRDEVIDTGLARLRDAAVAAEGRPVDALLDDVLTAMAGDGGKDDTVLVGVRWTT